MCMHVCTPIRAWDHKDQKNVSDPLELEYQAIASQPMWMLGT